MVETNTNQAQDTVKTVVSCDGDKLAGAMRRVVPFAAEGGREDLAAVYAESNNGVLELTSCDGFRMAHLTISLPFPAGEYLLAVAGVKDFADRHYNGQPVNIGCFVADTLKIGDVTIPVLQKKYINYPSLVPETFEVEAIIDTKKWIKAIRGSGAEKVGVVFNQAGCKMYSQGSNGETLGCDPLPVQMFSGPERKVMYKAEHFRRALTSCGATATIQVPAVGKPTLLEADDYWHVIIPIDGFPREVALTDKERETITLAEEILKSVKSGEVQGRILMGSGKLYVEIGPQVERTEVLTVEPKLAEPPKPSETP